MDLIEGEINKKNVSKIKCPFCDEKLTDDAIKLFFNKESVKIWKVDNYPFVVLNEKTNELLEKGFDLMKRLLLMFAVTALGGAGAINMM